MALDSREVKATMGFRYKLLSRDGDELGELVTAVPNWTVGDSLMTGEGRRFRLLSIVPLDDWEESVYQAMFIVDPIET